MNRSVRVLGIIVAAQAALVCSTFDEWITLGAFAGLAIALVIGIHSSGLSRKQANHDFDARSPVKPLWVMAGMLIIAIISIAWRVPGNMGEGVNVVAVAVDTLAHFSLLTTLMLWALRPSRGHALMPFLGLTVVLLCVASGGVSRSLQAQTTVGVFACLGFLSVTKIVFPQRASRGAEGQAVPIAVSSEKHLGQAFRQRRVVIIATASALMMVTGAVASVTEMFLPSIQNDLQKRLQSTIEVVEHNRLVGGMRYVRGSSLGSIRQHLTIDPQAIVMVIYSNQRPGYLRGNVFDLYRDSRWYSVTEQIASDDLLDSPLADRSVSPIGRGRVKLKTDSGSNLNRFELAPVDSGRQAEMEIVGDPMRGNNAFLPLGTRWMEARSYALTITCHQAIRVGVDTSKPYVVGAESGPAEVTLSETERMLLTEVAPEQREKLSLIADTIFQNAQSTREKTDAVAAFFQSNFSYGLESIRRPPNVDPVLHFLNSRHPAHCEYFATATVLLLRAAGVPTRYVVGYAADEESDDRGRWLARNRDAHAWAEAYDDATQRWFAVESTPGRSYQSVSPPDALASQTEIDAGLAGESDSSGGVRGFLSNMWGYLFSIRATDTFFVIFRYGQVAILIGLIGWLVGRLRRANETPGEVAERVCRKMLARVDRMLGRKGFVREPSESLYQFANRVEREVSEPTNQLPEANQAKTLRATEWLRSFADARYQGNMPQDWIG